MSYSYADAYGNSSGTPLSGFALGTQPSRSETSNGFTRFLSELIPVVENAADAFRQAKGLPVRYAPAREQGMSGYNLGDWLAARSQARRDRMDAPISLVEDTDDYFRQALAKIFADPDVLKDASSLYASPSIDPASLGVKMIPTPTPRYAGSQPGLTR